MEAVILAGGFGTRLSHVVSGVPKPMAPVAGRPFISYLLMRLRAAGIRRVVLATGYLHHVVERYFGSEWGGLEIAYSEEKEPLLTGGAILKAARCLTSDDFLVLNGDTLFDIDLTSFILFHKQHQSPLSLALREVDDTARYGAVLTEGTVVTCFREKDASAGKGVINGGVYMLNREWLLSQHLPQKFSFEKEVLQKRAHERLFHAKAYADYFIDIGIPDDYYRAQREFKSSNRTQSAQIGRGPFLFLDRDGVLNRQRVGDYVRSWEQWEWIDGALEAVAVLSKRFRRIFIVSNQQGVSKGLFSEEALQEIHRRMLEDIRQAGGRIDRVYVCTDLADCGSTMRKPQTGMALLARQEFPEVDFSRSLMVGDSLTDMQFGFACGMQCFYLTNNNPVPPQVRDYTDVFLKDLSKLK